MNVKAKTLISTIKYLIDDQKKVSSKATFLGRKNQNVVSVMKSMIQKHMRI